jgi:outer membrane lipoprotein-sorting protein
MFQGGAIRLGQTQWPGPSECEVAMKLLPTSPRPSRRARWAVPAGAVAVVATVTAAAMTTTAAASPVLPARTPAQLLTALASHAGPPPAMSGTVVESAALGIPQLPGEENPSSVLSMLTGSHTIRLWYADPAHLRLQLPVPLGETDVIRDGSTAWIWQSSSDSVQRIMVPARHFKAGAAPGGAQSQPALTPQQAAQQLLTAVGPSTSVRSGPTTTVAGQDAYQLVIAPKDGRSLIGRVVIALDAQHPAVPLEVQVFARGASSPAFQTGFTSIAFGAPPASIFAFTPPKGASVHTMTPMGHPAGWTGVPPGSRPDTAGVKVIGKNWLSVAVLPASALSALTQGGNAAGALGQAAQSAAAGPGSGPGGGVDAAGVLAGLLGSATHVSGAWGSGRLVKTSLVSMLITSNGHVLIGAVAPSVLYGAAAQAG